MKTKGKLSSSGAAHKELKQELAPSRFSRTTVTGPNDMARAMNNYSKIQKPEPKDSFGSFGAMFGG